MAAVKRNLKMHNKLLLDVIKRQAGTLHKAILEGTMNAEEANATKIDINFEAEVQGEIALLSISDNGIGIQSEKEIEQFFETFGTPHSESENKIWAQFRMGRGQIFSFGKNTWRTSTFRMIVDIDKWGLTYELEKDLPEVKGLQIEVELYKNPIGTYGNYNSVKSFRESVKKQVEFMEGIIRFNGEQINTPASTVDWAAQDENAYYLFGVGTDVSIYNMGAFTMNMEASRAGTTGVIVSKKQLKVNFARNDVQYDCPVYQEIQEVIRANRIKKTRRSSPRLEPHERQAVLADFRDGVQEYSEIKGISLIKTSQGRRVTLDSIRKNRQLWTFAPEGSRMADRAMEMGTHLCLDENIMAQLSYDGEENVFFEWLAGGYDYDFKHLKNLYVSYQDGTNGKSLADSFTEGYTTLPDKKLTVVERRIIKILNDLNCWSGRSIGIGISDTANAWTDGSTYIILERSFVKNLSKTWCGDLTKLFTTLIHELAHDDDTTDTHYHGEEFYRKFYELCCDRSNSPLQYISRWTYAVKQSRLEERQCKIVQKEKKEKEKRDKVLGLK